jgi:hypothetical protein
VALRTNGAHAWSSQSTSARWRSTSNVTLWCGTAPQGGGEVAVGANDGGGEVAEVRTRHVMSTRQEACQGPTWARGGLVLLALFVLVAGTFEMTPKGHVVREYFVTDGVSLANAAMPGRCDAIAGVVRSADRLVSTLQFETVSCALDPQASTSTSRSAT